MSQLNSSQAGDKNFSLSPFDLKEKFTNENRFSSSLFFLHFIKFLLPLKKNSTEAPTSPAAKCFDVRLRC